MELIKVTEENIEKEHICCAISNNNDIQVSSKKKWLQERFREGLVFLKGNVRGKCFIEYIPAEYAWAPIDADGYMYIDCLWVSGQFKGHGYSNQLLQACIDDAKAKGKKGLVILSSTKKMGYLSDPKFMKYKGFQIADSADPYFQLLYLPFEGHKEVPKFKKHIHDSVSNVENGYVLYYTNQCPFTAKYVPLLAECAATKNVEIKVVRIETTKQAQEAPSPFTTFSLFYKGNLVSHEILSEKKFEKIIEENMK